MRKEKFMPYIDPLRNAEPRTEQPVTVLDWGAFLLLLMGGLNLGLYAVFGIDAVGAVLGSNMHAVRLLHALVGCAALYGMVRTLQTGHPL